MNLNQKQKIFFKIIRMNGEQLLESFFVESIKSQGGDLHVNGEVFLNVGIASNPEIISINHNGDCLDVDTINEPERQSPCLVSECLFDDLKKIPVIKVKGHALFREIKRIFSEKCDEVVIKFFEGNEKIELIVDYRDILDTAIKNLDEKDIKYKEEPEGHYRFEELADGIWYD